MSKAVFEVWKPEHFEKLSSFIESKGFILAKKVSITGRIFSDGTNNNSNHKATETRQED